MKTLLGVAITMALAAATEGAEPGTAEIPAAQRVFEMRIYKANPGKLDALHARFRDHTCRLFKKHGIEVVGFWTPIADNAAADTLVYLLAFPSAEAQQQAWKAFRADPEWQKAKADSEKDGVLVKDIESRSMRPTGYSPLR